MILRQFFELLLKEVGTDEVKDRERLKIASAALAEQIIAAPRFCFTAGVAALALQMSEEEETQGLAVPLRYPSMWIDMPTDPEGLRFALFWIGDSARDPTRQGVLFVINYRDKPEPVVVPYPVDLNEAITDVPTQATVALLKACSYLLAMPGMCFGRKADFTKLNRQRAANNLYPLLDYWTMYLTAEGVDALRPKQGEENLGSPVQEPAAH